MKPVLAIDQSTSATKVCWIDPAGEVVARAERPHRQHYPQAGWVEHDAEEIWQNLRDAAAEVLACRMPAERESACLSLANQRETVVVFERATGRPLAPAIVWQCRRGDAICHEHIRAGREELVRQRTGLAIDGYFSAPKLQWLMRERPDLARAMDSGDALIGTIDSYLIYRLTEGAVHASDVTNASRTLLFDIHTLKWDEDLCALWQVPVRALPQVHVSDRLFGHATLGAKGARPLPIRGVMGDSQAALFAQGCTEPGNAKATLGTGSSILVNVGRQRPQGLRGTMLGLAWVLDGVPCYALEGLVIYCAATLAWLRDQLGLLDDPTASAALAEELAANEGVYLVPAFSGLGAPYWDERARAAILGLSGRSDRRHIVRAALESIAYQMRDVLEMLGSESGVPIGELACDGGPCSNAFLMQFIADVSGVPLRVGERADLAARGAALMGLCGWLGRDAVASSWGRGAQVNYRPLRNAASVAADYEGWLHAVSSVRAHGQPTGSVARPG